MSYDPDLYRLVHRGHEGDVAFYRQACEGASSVLELGCGWGRVLCEVARVTSTAVGVEVDREMSRRARRELPPEVHVVRADMAAFAFRRRFDRVIAPYSGLFCLPREKLRACFRRARAHLADDGLLVFDVWHADGFHAESSPEDLADDALLPVVAVEHDGTIWDVYERSRWSPEAQRLTSTYVHVPRDGRAAREGTITHHYFLVEELPVLLGEAGLYVDGVDSGFGGPGSDTVVVTARPV